MNTLAAVRRPPSKIELVPGVPDVIDFPRDIQPILDRLCVDCHGYEKTPRGGPREARLLLAGDRGPIFSHSYYMLTIARLFSDGRNDPRSNYAPRELGSAATKLFKYMNGSHHAAAATEEELNLVRLWVESGAAYPGTYAALGTGMIGAYEENKMVNPDFEWPTTRTGAEVLKTRCADCHDKSKRVLPLAISDERGDSFWRPNLQDESRSLTTRHVVFNLSRPHLSPLLLAPLSKAAGGWGLCRGANPDVPVFADSNDPDYQTLLAMCSAGKYYLDENKRFDMPGFVPRKDWVREMRRYGVLPAESDPATINVYEVEQRYWRSLWHPPSLAEVASRE